LLEDKATAEEIKKSWLKLENIKRSLDLDDSNLESENYRELLKEAKYQNGI
jgi:adenylate cyclase class IV